VGENYSFIIYEGYATFIAAYYLVIFTEIVFKNNERSKLHF
jgi:hypothetical protein